MIPTLALDTTNSEGGSGLTSSTSAIVGGTIGGAAGVALIAAGLILYKRRQKRQMMAKSSEMYDNEFYGDPYQHNNEWMTGGRFTGTGEGRTSLDDEHDFYTSQHRKSWWSSVTTVFQRSR